MSIRRKKNITYIEQRLEQIGTHLPQNFQDLV